MKRLTDGDGTLTVLASALGTSRRSIIRSYPPLQDLLRLTQLVTPDHPLTLMMTQMQTDLAAIYHLWEEVLEEENRLN